MKEKDIPRLRVGQICVCRNDALFELAMEWMLLGKLISVRGRMPRRGDYIVIRGIDYAQGSILLEECCIASPQCSDMVVGAQSFEIVDPTDGTEILRELNLIT